MMAYALIYRSEIVGDNIEKLFASEQEAEIDCQKFQTALETQCGEFYTKSEYYVIEKYKIE